MTLPCCERLTDLHLSLDQPGQHHMVMRADRARVLIGGPGKSDHVIPDRGEGNHFIHESRLGAIQGAGFVIVVLGQGVHSVDDRLERFA